jgi:hypothetical protein
MSAIERPQSMNAPGLILLWSLANLSTSVPAEAEQWHEVVVGPSVIPGGIADPAGRNGFVANVEGGLSAIDLRNGKVLWETKVSRRPITVTGERVYASIQAGPGLLRVAGFDLTRHGEAVFESGTIALPPDSERHPLTVRWFPHQYHLKLTWELEGIASIGGGATVDLRTGRVSPTADGPPSERMPPPDLTKRVIRWQGVVGDSYKALVLEESALAQQLVLHSWSQTTGQHLSSQELIQGQRLLLRASLDGRYLCLRDSVPSPDQQADERGAHAWSIFDAATGGRIARLPYERGTQAIAVLGPRAFVLVAGGVAGTPGQPFVNPRVLKAIDLKTGKTLWERPAEGKNITPIGK